jgi:hypothetical protein
MTACWGTVGLWCTHMWNRRSVHDASLGLVFGINLRTLALAQKLGLGFTLNGLSLGLGLWSELGIGFRLRL